ncbi:GNAT family N-acetyltransferase [Gottfriedia acidiceleris]|uniref:GNAT family N-acetyltransferase n=1 Tax=Gottfriedia acidiceleris TaxID=371036 RepID=UPI002FFD9D6D
MKLIKYEKSVWDIEKEIIFGKVEEGIFEFYNLELGNELNQEWWKLVGDNEEILGFGWINYKHGDFEFSLVVNQESRGYGIGSFIVEELERIAREKNFKEVLAIIKQSNPNSLKTMKWFYEKGYTGYVNGFEGREMKTREVAAKMVKKMDVHLIKQIALIQIL